MATPDILLRTDQAVELIIVNPDTGQPDTLVLNNYHFDGGGYDRYVHNGTFSIHDFSAFLTPRFRGLDNGSDKIKWAMDFTVRLDQDEVRKLQRIFWVSERRKDLNLAKWITVRDRRQLFGEPGTTNTRPISFGTVEVNNRYAEYYADFDMAFSTVPDIFRVGSTILGRPGPIRSGTSVINPSGALRMMKFSMLEGDKRVA